MIIDKPFKLELRYRITQFLYFYDTPSAPNTFTLCDPTLIINIGKPPFTLEDENSYEVQGRLMI